ncbi:MAG TPA: DUF3108 domain-containing protein [Polyangia bacterium]|nr:DUF3108 domain-containing protein [Polyangia bacterium]
MSVTLALALLALGRPASPCDEWPRTAALAAPAVGPPRTPPPGAPPLAFPAAAPPRPVPPALAQAERARYRIEYGVIEIGELEVAIAKALPGSVIVHADGRGTGGVLGLGHMESRIATDFDLARLESRSWDSARSGGEGDLRDRGTQRGAGRVDLVRERPGRAGAPERASATLAAPLLDPLGFLLRLRVDLPAAGPQILYVLDGQALWRVTIASAGRVAPPENVAPVPMVRLDAEAEPILWSGAPDGSGEREHRSFRLWLSDDAARVPLRLEMPVGIADVVVALTELSRR